TSIAASAYHHSPFTTQISYRIFLPRNRGESTWFCRKALPNHDKTLHSAKRLNRSCNPRMGRHEPFVCQPRDDRVLPDTPFAVAGTTVICTESPLTAGSPDTRAPRLPEAARCLRHV